MSIIENLVGKSVEFTIGGSIKICRKFVQTDGILENSYTLYTSVKKTDQLIQEQESHASIVMVHGLGQRHLVAQMSMQAGMLLLIQKVIQLLLVTSRTSPILALLVRLLLNNNVMFTVTSQHITTHLQRISTGWLPQEELVTQQHSNW